MGIISSILPAIRHLRAPLSSGLLWFLVLALAFRPDIKGTLDLPPIKQVLDTAGPSGHATVPAFMVGVAYILGIINQSIFGGIVSWAGNLLRKLVVRGNYSRLIRKPNWLWRRIFENDKHFRVWPLTPACRVLLLNSITGRIARTGVPPIVAMAFPEQEVIRSLPSSAVQLSQENQSQYDEYDRLHAEAEFRIAIAPPILFLAIIFPSSHKIALVAAAVIVAVALLLQAAQKIREQYDLLANCLYIDSLRVPMLENIILTLNRVKDFDSTREGVWFGLLAHSLWKNGHFEEAEGVIGEAVDFSNERSRRDLYGYLKGKSSELLEVFEREVRDRQQENPSGSDSLDPVEVVLTDGTDIEASER